MVWWVYSETGLYNLGVSVQHGIYLHGFHKAKKYMQSSFRFREINLLFFENPFLLVIL